MTRFEPNGGGYTGLQRPRYRNEEARLDALVEDAELRAAGVVEDDEPTEYSHEAHMSRLEREATAEFTPTERAAIRMHLGFVPFEEKE